MVNDVTPVWSLAKEWAQYRDMVLPKTMLPAQIAELEIAFYAGAYVVTQTVIELGSSDAIDDEVAAEKLQAVYDEAEAFAQAVVDRAQAARGRNGH